MRDSGGDILGRKSGLVPSKQKCLVKMLKHNFIEVVTYWSKYMTKRGSAAATVAAVATAAQE